MSKGFMSYMLRIAGAVLAQVLKIINEQIIRLETEIVADLHAIVSEITSGEVWKARGAEIFVESVNSELLPSLNRAIALIQEQPTKLVQATEIIEEADVQAARLVSNLREEYENI